MDRWIDGWTDKWMDRWIDRWMEESATYKPRTEASKEISL